MATTAKTMTVTQLVDNAALACDRIAVDHPDFAGMIAEMKADLIRLPSAGHVKCVVGTLLEIAEGTYTEDF